MMAVPKNAATVILLKDKEPEGLEVFLLRRHEKSSFMGGNFVYPGGRVDRDDDSLEICSFPKGITFDEAQKILGGTIFPEESFAHWIAGIRELFEEAGVLLAYDQKGKLFQTKNRDEQQKFSNYRTLLQRGEITICQVAQGEKLLFALETPRAVARQIKACPVLDTGTHSQGPCPTCRLPQGSFLSTSCERRSPLSRETRDYPWDAYL